jgi:DNA invertase Pin-like site-specific DNA recombinase
MHSTNGYAPKRAILYARVSTDEQARSGYSLAQQLEALNVWCEIWVHHPNKSAKANRGRPNCSLSQMQKLCRATLAAKRARNPLSS